MLPVMLARAILTVSFFLLNTGMATDVIRSRLWACVLKSYNTEILVHET